MRGKIYFTKYILCTAGKVFLTFFSAVYSWECGDLGCESTYDGFRVAELGSLSSGAKMAMKIFASNASFLHVVANLPN